MEMIEDLELDWEGENEDVMDDILYMIDDMEDNQIDWSDEIEQYTKQMIDEAIEGSLTKEQLDTSLWGIMAWCIVVFGFGSCSGCLCYYLSQKIIQSRRESALKNARSRQEPGHQNRDFDQLPNTARDAKTARDQYAHNAVPQATTSGDLPPKVDDLPKNGIEVFKRGDDDDNMKQIDLQPSKHGR